MSAAADHLRAAKALIDAPERWTKGAFARRADGLMLMRGESWDQASCFCAEGAIRRSQNGVLPHVLDAFMERAIPKSFKFEAHARNFVMFNDHPDTTHADIMALFDRAISLADREAGDA